MLFDKNFFCVGLIQFVVQRNEGLLVHHIKLNVVLLVESDVSVGH